MELKGTKTEKNLMEAFAGESMARNKYTYFASVAKKEGYEQLAAIFEEQREGTRQAVVQGPLRRLHPRHPDLPRHGSQRRERRVDRYVPPHGS